ncbi:hypothetical protein DL93DRAFT_2160117, partial [Clavulina sp. PMI_390]
MAHDTFWNPNQAIDSLDRLISSMNFDATPLMLHHPPSRRSSITSSLNSQIEGLNAYCAEAELLFEKISQIKKRLLHQLHACVSALTPIAALPIEVLRGIFDVVVKMGSHSIPTLMAVCHPWKSIVSEQPSLWTHMEVPSGDSFGPVTAHRSHSASFPLSLEVHE